MDWKLDPAERTENDPYGLEQFLRRLQNEFGKNGPLSGFTFINDAREMLAFSRRIEQAMLASGSRGSLYAGFQTAAKLEGEAERYRHMSEHRVVTHGFGVETPVRDAIDVVASWTTLSEQHAALENQWFLVTLDPEPIAFVGWEVSDSAVWGKGGISASGKVFAGFVSDEASVVSALIERLEVIRHTRVEGPSSNVARGLTGAKPELTMIVVDDGKRAYLRRAFDAACRGAFGESKLLLFDLSAASYLVNPYPDDEDAWKRPHSSRTLRRAMGRGYLANLIDELATFGIEAEAVLPEGVGLKHLTELSDLYKVDVLIVPVEFTQPALMDRLRGNSLSALGTPKARVVVESEEQIRTEPSPALVSA